MRTITKTYKNKLEMELGIINLSKENWHVINIEKSNSKTLGCSGCCIFPFPLFWYSRQYDVNYGNEDDDQYNSNPQNDETVPLEQEYDARRNKN